MNYNTRINRKASQPVKVNTFVVALTDSHFTNVNNVHCALGKITYNGGFIWTVRTERTLQQVIELLIDWQVNEFTVKEI